MQRMLKRPEATKATSTYTTAPANGNVESLTAACVSELMNAATSFHKLHLKVTGTGSYAAHKALNDLYDALPGHADDLAEGFQGASEKLLSCGEAAPRKLDTVADGIDYLKDMCDMVCKLQDKMPYSEIVNDLDTIKSTINSAKYKLLFLK
jgi:DNA-binding ferritin-like protein